MMPFAVIPAQPNTFLMTYDGSRSEARPVVGWRCLEAGAAVPVVAADIDVLAPGSAILSSFEWPDEPYPHWVVIDLATGESFDSVRDWEDWIDNERPYVPGEKNAAAERLNTMSRPVLSFSGRVYAKASFWKIAPPGGHLSVFSLPGGEKSPTNPFVTKITRDEFYAARKNVTELPFETLKADAQPIPKGEPEDDDEDLI